MSLSAKVTAAVDKAFTAANDLVKQGTLSNKKVSSYNFGTGSVESQSRSIPVEIIIYSSSRSSGGDYTYNAILKSGVDLSVYDTLTVEKKEYKIVDFTDNDFVIEVTLKKVP